MDTNQYQAFVEDILNKGQTYEEYIDRDAYDRDTFGFVVAAAKLEQYKKTLNAGKNLPKFPSINPLTADDPHVIHAKLGIAGEAGEVFDAETKDEVRNEVGDLLWYVTLLLSRYGLTLDDALSYNYEKLNKRFSTGQFTQSEALNPSVR